MNVQPNIYLVENLLLNRVPRIHKFIRDNVVIVVALFVPTSVVIFTLPGKTA